MKCDPGDWRGSVRGNILASLMSNKPAGVTCDDNCSSLMKKNAIWRKSLCADIITQGYGSAWKSNSTWHERRREQMTNSVWKYHRRSSSTHTHTHEGSLLIHRTQLSHTCANEEGGVPPHRLHHHHRVFATFEVGSDASIVARCASHQFVQKIRWRGRFGRPAGELHLFTEPRPASDRTNMATCAAMLFSF